MSRDLFRRTVAIAAVSAAAAALSVVATATSASATPVASATYSATTTSDQLSLDASLASATVTDARLGATTATATALPQASTATASNLRAPAAGLNIPLQNVTQSAPPDNATAATGVFNSIGVPPLISAPPINGSAHARLASSNATCLPSGTPISTSSAQTANVTVGSGLVPLPAQGGVLGDIANVGTISSASSTSLVSTGGAADTRAVQSQATSQVAQVNLLGGSVQIALVGTSTLTAQATGNPATSGATYTPATVAVTALGTPRTLDPNQPLVIPVDLRLAGTGVLATVTLSRGQLTNVQNTGTSVSASASVISAVIAADSYLGGLKVASIANVTLGIGPMSVAATAPANGVQCGPPPATPTITDPTSGSVVTTNQPTITGTGTSGDTIVVTGNGGSPVCGPVAVVNGTWSCVPAAGLPQGSNTIIATETNPAGSTPSLPDTFTVDSATVPAPAIITPIDGSTVNNATVAFTGSGISGDTVTVMEAGHAICSGLVVAQAWNCSPATGLTVGPHTVFAIQQDPTSGIVSGSSNVVHFTTAVIGTRYTPTTPYRVLDTRSQSQVGPVTGPVSPGGTVTVSANQLGIPAGNASAIVLNLTVATPAGAGFLSAYPSDQTPPTVSTLNYASGQNRANLSIVPVAADGSIRIATYQQAHLVADVFGYFATNLVTNTGGLFHNVTPSRLLDTREGGNRPLSTGEIRPLPILGRASVSTSGVSAVVLNVTASRPTAAGYISAFPTGAPFNRTTSNVNFVAGDIASTRVIVPVGDDGSVSFYNNFGDTQLVVDITGYFTSSGSGDLTGAQFVAVSPTRTIDTRPPSINTADAPLAPGEIRQVQLTGTANVPTAGTVAVVSNLTGVGPTIDGYLTQYAAGIDKPFVSDVNFIAKDTVANLTIAQVDLTGASSIYNYNGGRTDVIEDVSGYFQNPVAVVN